MTVDVEDYFQVSAFDDVVSRDDWEKLPRRVERNTHQVLGLFERHRVKGTFFVLGWVAERFPQLLRAIVENGHELASHGFSHVRANRQSPHEFKEDVARTKAILENVTGTEVLGYRAASFSIGSDNLWTLDVLQEAGYLYSSSVYPVQHDHYGSPELSRFPHRREGGAGVLEVPITTTSILNRNIPCGGGGYFRLLPYVFNRWAIRRVNRRDRASAVFYFHPWEIDPGQPRQRGLSMKTRFRHYTNLSCMEAKLERLLTDFRWGRMDEIFLSDGLCPDASCLAKASIAPEQPVTVT